MHTKMKLTTKLLLLTVTFVLTSCVTSRKQMIYLEDMAELQEYPVSQEYEATIHCDDKLNIVVSCKNPELAYAFNLPGNGGYRVSETGNVVQSTTTFGDNIKEMGYSVDKNGNIDFPVLGQIHVEGLTRNQLRDLIKDELTQRQLLTDPVVFVDLMNFKFSVLGEVNHVGTFMLKGGDRITILEALAQAGDLKETSRIDRVAVIRDVGKKRRILHVDLRSKDLFLSPAYYLQQNDIVYVEPNNLKATQRSRQTLSYVTTGFSLLSTATMLVLYLTK